MSGFTDACRAQAVGAWRTTGAWPEKYTSWKKGPGPSGRAQRGCLGFLIFGVVYIFLPLLIFLAVAMVLVAYALLMSLLWGIGATVDVASSREPRRG